MIRKTWQAIRLLGLLSPVCAIARKPGGTDEVASSLTGYVRAGWSSWGLGAPPHTASCIMLTGGRSPLNKVVVLLFADDEAEPRLALKFARVPESVPALEREALALTAVAERSLATRAEIPSVVFNGGNRGLRILAETPVTGLAVSTTLTPERYPKIAARVAELLASFAGHAPLSPPRSWWDRLIEPVLTDFAGRFCDVPEIGAVDSIRRRLMDLPALPLVPEHRDCSPWNVLLTREDQLALLDWESAEPAGLPALDLIYFLSNASFLLDGTLGSGRELQTYARLIERSDWLRTVYTDTLASYSRTVGVELRDLSALRTFAWMIHALSQPHAAERRAADAGSGNLFVALWRHDVRSGHHVESGSDGVMGC